MTAMNADTPDERRRFIRVPKESIVSCRLLSMEQGEKSEIRSRLVNISSCGILIKSSEAFSEGAVLVLQIQLQRWQKYSSDFIKFDQTSLSEPFVAVGKVVRVQPGETDSECFLGISLENVDAGHKDTLERYLQYLLSAAN